MSQTPQVKVVDGRIVVNEESLYATRADDVELTDMDVVNESGTRVTSSSFRKKKPRDTWTLDDTELFYKALSMVGTDFSMVSLFFEGKTRAQIKNKFKREERSNPGKITLFLKKKIPLDMKLIKKKENNDNVE